MKKLVLTTLMWSVVWVTAVTAGQETEVLEARGLVKEFFVELKSQLSAAVKAGGPVTAISVCNVTAPAIARNLAHRSGWEVGRTSLKQRNPANRPDAWETTILEEFEARKAAGEAVKGMEFSQVVADENGKYFRYMKAIPISEICLKCHGREIAPDVQDQLIKLYPGDQAKDYVLGDIRGAFTLSKPL